MTRRRSFLPTFDEVKALERELTNADPPVDPAELTKIEKYKSSLRKHGRKLRYIPLLGSAYALLSILDWPAPWWSTVIAAATFAGAGWLWGERLGLVGYRHLLERQLLPPREPDQLTASGTEGPVAVPALGDRGAGGAPQETSGKTDPPDDVEA